MSLRKQSFESLALVCAMLLTGLIIGCSSSSDSSTNTNTDTNTDAGTGTDTSADVAAPDSTAAMTFFLTSAGPGDGGNIGGLAGADVHCANLAEAAGTEGVEWRAYLSTTGADGINAIERIGAGPWVNANGVTIATSTENLLSDDNNINIDTAIDENGVPVNGIGATPNRHDILTGTELNGMASTEAGDSTCENWTSNGFGNAIVGHHDRDGGGANPESWSSAHGTVGCSQTNLQTTGGDGLFYCFALNQ